jgi:hypothetical protein
MKTILFLTVHTLLAICAIPPILGQSVGVLAVGELRHRIELGLSQTYGHNITSFRLQQAKPGYAASGVIVVRFDDALALDITPCGEPKTILTFIMPYTDTQISEAQCGTRTYPRRQVVQQ